MSDDQVKEERKIYKYLLTYTERTARFCDKDDYFFDEKSKADFALDMCLLRKSKNEEFKKSLVFGTHGFGESSVSKLCNTLILFYKQRL